MARRRAIEADELFETANRLVAEGKDVTATSLLDALGGGSLRTIYKLMEVWESEKRPAAVAAGSNDIPSEVMAGFTNAWRLVTSAAEKNIQAAREQASEEVAAAISKFQVALDASEKLEVENEALLDQIEELKKSLSEWEGAAHAALAECAAHKATIEQLEKQNGKQERDFARLREEAEEERHQHKQAQNLANATIEQVKVALKKAEEKAAKFEGEAREHSKIVEQKQQALDKAEDASRVDRAERDTALKEAAEQKGRCEALDRQVEQLLERLTKPDEKKGRN